MEYAVVAESLNFISAGNAFLITTPSVSSRLTKRPAITLLLSLNDTQFRVSAWPHGESICKAVLIAPNTWRELDAKGCNLLSINIEPGHPAYLPICRSIGDSTIMPLASDRYFCLREVIRQIYESDFDKIDLDLFVSDAIDLTIPKLQVEDAVDGRIGFLLDHLDSNGGLPKKTTLLEMADIVDLSKDRLSHLFVESIGLPMRSYMRWRRYRYAMSMLRSGTPLVELAFSSGYADASHMTREFVGYLGFTPSLLRNNGFSYHDEI
ncbi:helix-turn-helix domain-containing protein [Burkholderia cepacia]|uniref:helix-turn-helix domain-containing protein n=1 Tax=Burkholderia cepacia TaxID=292 RepID=UPI000F5EBEEB|nr:AraC family transcriptional regulator [Burkholderia cepacia]